MGNRLQNCKYLPAWLAADSGLEGILKLLLEKTDMDINRTFRKYGHTLLLEAAIMGNNAMK